MSAKKPAQVSGWYGKEKLSEAERAEQQRLVAEWYRQRIDLNYRQMVVEAPGPMILALGKMAQERSVPFGEFIEGILVEYLARQGVEWRGQT